MLKFLLTGGADGNMFERAPVPDAKKALGPSVHSMDFLLTQLLPPETHLQAGTLSSKALPPSSILWCCIAVFTSCASATLHCCMGMSSFLTFELL